MASSSSSMKYMWSNISLLSKYLPSFLRNIMKAAKNLFLKHAGSLYVVRYLKISFTSASIPV